MRVLCELAESSTGALKRRARSIPVHAQILGAFPVSVLGNLEVCIVVFPRFLGWFVVVEKHNGVGVLLDGPRFSQVAQFRLSVFGLAIQLAEAEYGNIKLSGHLF